jgi:hypothetical protein
MTMPTADLTALAADVAAIIAERPLPVAFRRGALTLPAQTARLFATGDGATRRGEATAAARWPLVLLGPADLDVRIGDRFNDYGGALCEVVDIHNDRRAFTQAGATLAQ